MGQQQLLLLVLSIVLVGLAVVGGIQVFKEGQERNRKEMRVGKLLTVATRIQAWGQTPAAMGGGSDGGTINWTRFRLENVGIEGEQLNNVNWRWRSQADGMGCFVIYVNPNQAANVGGARVHLHLLDDSCELESWRTNPYITMSGETLGDINTSLAPPQ